MNRRDARALGRPYGRGSAHPDWRRNVVATAATAIEGKERSVEHFETIVIGGGQAGLAVGYYLKKLGRSFVILDANERIGGSWRTRCWKARSRGRIKRSTTPSWVSR